MTNQNYCECGTPWLEANDNCSRCNKKVNPERAELIKSDPISLSNTSTSTDQTQYNYPDLKVSAFGKKAETVEQQKEIGNAAAHRTVKYASLFENIGNVMQILNLIGACVLIAAGFFITGPGWVKFIYWVAVLILWAFSYVQTSLIRGLASYFQMKASDHIIRHWQK
jgi:hypothetical protein